MHAEPLVDAPTGLDLEQVLSDQDRNPGVPLKKHEALGSHATSLRANFSSTDLRLPYVVRRVEITLKHNRSVFLLRGEAGAVRRVVYCGFADSEVWES